MDRIFIGIPILNRLDLLERCIEAIDYPAEIVVIDNNSIDREFRSGISRLAEEREFEVLHQARNLGVAASWNLIVRTGMERGHEWFFIGSNDTFLHPGSLKAAIQFPKDDDVAVWYIHSSDFFLLNRRTIDEIGWFDENFYPAYKEDQDYSYRCDLAGKRRVNVPRAGADHVGSATVASNPHYAARNHDTHFNWNRNHYIMKWGGDAGRERFRHPYDDPSHDFHWWPDPGGSIAVRDWDNIVVPSLRELYDRAASTPSDIWEHVPTLYKYATTVHHITEFGTSLGNSTSALLFARPRTLTTYDLHRHPRVSELEAAARNAGVSFRFIQADVRDLPEIELTDLLFIDTHHVRRQMEMELRFARKVRRYLIMHDTETFGIDGEGMDGADGPEGIWHAVGEFVRDSREWEIHQIWRNNNGLTILQRTTESVPHVQ